MNIINTKTDKSKFDLNEFRSQSVQDRETFLNTYYNKKSTNISMSKHELDSKILDLNRKLTKKLQINESTSTPILSSASIPISSGCSSINNSSEINNCVAVSSATNTSSLNNHNNNESSFFDSIYETNSTSENTNNKTDDDFKSVYSLSNDINTFPCMTLSNRIDELVPSANIFNNYDINKTNTTEHRVNFRNNTTFKDSDDFIFLPEDISTERFSILSYEVLSKSDGLHIDYTIHIKEFQHTTLEQQSFKCADCKTQIKSSKNVRRCYYFGKLYCKICHQNDKLEIPAKLIKTLDTKKYPVCNNAKYMLDSVYRRGIFDIIYDNCELYDQSALLNDCRLLRMQLEHIKNYLQTCKNKQVNNTFIMHLWPDDYLYDSKHLYSLYDLVNLKDVFIKLKNACDFGVKHILKDCDLCKMKGFFCELCKYDKVIYPFQLNIISRCDDCGSIYHKECRLKISECPKCKRLASRK